METQIVVFDPSDAMLHIQQMLMIGLFMLGGIPALSGLVLLANKVFQL